MKRRALITLVVLSYLSVKLIAQNKTFYETDFDSEDQIFWTGTDKYQWGKVENGKYHFGSLDETTGRFMAPNFKIDKKKFSFETNVYSNPSNSHTYYGVILGKFPENCFGFLYLRINNEGEYRINFWGELLASGSFVKEGEFTSLKIVKNGKMFSFYINESRVKKLKLSEMDKIRFGPYTGKNNKSVTLDYVKILTN